MMEKYADNLEELVMERTGQLIEEKKKTDALLERMLPRCASVTTVTLVNSCKKLFFNGPFMQALFDVILSAIVSVAFKSRG